MAIEYLTPDLVLINGRAVELRERRQPDVFDTISGRENDQLQADYNGPITDIEFDMRKGIGP